MSSPGWRSTAWRAGREWTRARNRGRATAGVEIMDQAARRRHAAFACGAAVGDTGASRQSVPTLTRSVNSSNVSSPSKRTMLSTSGTRFSVSWLDRLGKVATDREVGIHHCRAGPGRARQKRRIELEDERKAHQHRLQPARRVPVRVYQFEVEHFDPITEPPQGGRQTRSQVALPQEADEQHRAARIAGCRREFTDREATPGSRSHATRSEMRTITHLLRSQRACRRLVDLNDTGRRRRPSGSLLAQDGDRRFEPFLNSQRFQAAKSVAPRQFRGWQQG